MIKKRNLVLLASVLGAGLACVAKNLPKIKKGAKHCTRALENPYQRLDTAHKAEAQHLYREIIPHDLKTNYSDYTMILDFLTNRKEVTIDQIQQAVSLPTDYIWNVMGALVAQHLVEKQAMPGAYYTKPTQISIHHELLAMVPFHQAMLDKCVSHKHLLLEDISNNIAK